MIGTLTVTHPIVPAPRSLAWIFPVLICATLLAYAPAWHGGELWDDDGHLTRIDLRSADGAWRIWIDIGATQQYYPVVHSAFWLMFQLWGTNTLGYHLVNIVLHATSAFLIALLLRRLKIPGAVPAAIVFALHPVHVESVAWMTELKNTLSGTLVLGAALAYLRFDDTRRARPYVLSLLLFTMALLSKSVTATLPVALLVVVWWQRGRIDTSRDLRPLAPFVVVGAAAGAMTVWVEQALIGAKGTEFDFTFIERTLIAGRALWFYLGKLVWPADLTFIYPRWNISPVVWWQYLFPLTMAAALVVCWRLRAKTRAPLAALLLFAVMLGPALGFVNVYPFRYSFVADHFQYLASIAIITFVVAALHHGIARRLGSAGRADVALAVVLGLPLGALTWSQSHDYVDAETLYRATIARNPTCWMAMHNLATLKVHGGDAEVREAVTLTEASLALNPQNAEAHNTLGLAMQRQGRMDEALPHLQESLRLSPAFAPAHNNLGAAAYRLGQLDEAERRFRDALRLDARYAEAHRNLGLVLMDRGQIDAAIVEFTTALQIAPESAEARDNLGSARLRQGRGEEAVREYAEAVRLKPGFAEAHSNLGLALELLNRPAEAEAEYREAIRLTPASSKALVNLGSLVLRAGRTDEAIAHFRDAVRAEVTSASAHYHLANALASTNQTADAIDHYRRAIAMQPDARSAIVHNDLGVALATAGRLADAITEFREALRLDPNLKDAKDNLARATRR